MRQENKKIERLTKVLDTIEYFVKNEIVAVNIYQRINNNKRKVVESFFIDENSFPKNTTKLFDYDDKKYVYFTKPEIKRLTILIDDRDEKLYSMFKKVEKQDAIKALRQKNMNKSNLVFIDWSSHTVYNMESDMPLSCSRRYGYIGGLTNEHFDLIKALKILKKSKFVSNIEKIDIPYYNAKHNDKAIEFICHLPQEIYDKMVKYYRDEKKEEFWMLKARECIAGHYLRESPFDPLGLKEAMISRW